MVSQGTGYRRVARNAGAGLALLASAGSVAAQPGDLCSGVETLVAGAQSNFADSAQTGVVTLPGAVSCAMTTDLSGVNAHGCTWTFVYRADQALATFGRFSRVLAACFGGRAVLGRDQRVNHPDFYDRRDFQLGSVTVTVSIKDKIAHGKTYVFVRVIGAGRD